MKRIITETNFNKWFKNGRGIVWQTLGITSTIGGSIFFFDLLGINKKVKKIFFKDDEFTKYDPEVVEKATEYYKEQYQKGNYIDINLNYCLEYNEIYLIMYNIINVLKNDNMIFEMFCKFAKENKFYEDI